MTDSIGVHSFGLMDYASAWRWQDRTAQSLRDGGPEALALLQHPPVYTMGRRTRYDHLLVSEDELRARGAGLVESDRGGDVTFHGPGQLVVYPILDLRRRNLGASDYVRRLEQTLILALEDFGLRGERVAGRPGVWVDSAKVAAIGVRVQAGVSLHGFALNVETDLSWFDAIIPCGISDASVTSVERLLDAGEQATAQRGKGLFDAACEAVLAAFAGVFDVGFVFAGGAGHAANHAHSTSLSQPSGSSPFAATREAVLSHGR